MALKVELEIARADMNDSYGVSLWQYKKLVDYSPDEARELAREIVAAADEADRVEAEDRKAAFPDVCQSLILNPIDGSVVL